MKPKTTLRLARTGSVRLALALTSLLAAHSAHATNLYWDTNGNGAGTNFGSVAGTWGSGYFWNTDSSGNNGGAVTALPTAGDDLNISAGTAGTILLSGTGTGSSLTLSDNVAVTINAGTLALGGTGTSSGLLITAADSSSTTINSIVALNNATSTVQNAGTGTLTLGGGLTGTQNLVLKNNGATAGGITLSGLSMINNAGTITNSGSGAGVTISADIGYNVTGVTQSSSSSSLTLSGVNLYTGDTKSSAGTLIIGNNLALQNSALDSSGSGFVTLSSSATPTFGGLKGGNNLSSVITSGYTSMTALTLNLGSGVSDTYSGIISNGSGNTTLTLTGAYGPGIQILGGANTYTGTTTISGGTLQIGNGSSGSLNGSGTASTFAGALTFNGYGGTLTVQEAAASTQGMGALTFSAGANTVNSTFNATSAALTFSSLAARTAGATGNFTTTGGTPGLTNSINVTGQAAGFIDKGIYFNGADFAAMNAVGTYVRALSYGSDPNAASINTITASNHVELTATPAARTGDTLLSLNLAGSGVGYTMSSGSLTVPGILKSGGGAVGIISGGTSLTTAGNAELVIRTDTASDLLKISTAITGFSGGLTKTGAGTLTLDASNGYTGTTTVVAGRLAESATGLIADGSALTVNGPTAIFDLGTNHNDTVSTVTLAGGGQITGTGTSTLTGGTLNLQCGTISSNITGSTIQKSTNGTVTITGAATTTGGNSAITGGALVITGPNASWNNGGQFQIGSTNANNAGCALTISNGAAMSVGGSWWTNGGSGNPNNNAPGTVLTVTGAGSNLNLTPSGDIGDRGSSAINILAGGVMNMNSVYVYYYGTSTGSTITVDGAGSYWKTGSNSGGNGTGYLITLSNGGTWNDKGQSWGLGSGNNGVAIGTGGTALSTVITNGLSTGAASDFISFNNGQIMASATATIISGSGPVTLNGSGYVNSNTYTATISSAVSGPGALYKVGAGQLTLSSASNTYAGGTNVNGGTLLLSGAIAMPTTGTVAVGAGGNFSLADGTARNTTVPALTVASGAVLTFDWTGASTVDALTSTANVATAAGNNIGIAINHSGTPSGSGTLITGGGGSTLNNANYFLANNTDYTAALTPAATTVSIGSYATATPLSGTVYWYGGQVTGALGSMNYSTGAVSNWSTAASYTSTALIPTGINAIFSTTSGASNQSAITLDADLSLSTVTFNDSNAITIGGSHYLTLTGTGTGASSALSIGTNSATTTTVNANIALGGSTSTWTIASGKTLVANGIITGPNNLSLVSGGSSTVKLTGANTYYGTTTIGSGVTLQLGDNTTSGSLSILSTIADSGTLTFNRSNNVTQGVDFAIGAIGGYGAAAISGGGALTQAGSGTLNLIGINSYTGVTTISNGILNSSTFAAIGSNSPIGNGVATSNATNAASLVISGGTLQYGGTTLATTNRLFTIGTSGATLDASGTGAGTLTIGSAGGSIAFSSSSAPALLTLTGTGTGSSGGGTLSAVVGDSGTNPNVTSLTKSGTGTWTLAAANTYSGTTAVNNGTLAVIGSGTLGNAAALSMGGGTLDLASTSQTVGAVSITAAAASGNTIQNGSLTGTSYAASNSSGNAIVSANLLLSGSAGLTKSGAGILTLSGTGNTYNGGNTVNNGTLAVSVGSTLGATTNALTLGGGALDLGTTSQTAGVVSVTAAAASGDTIRNGSLTGVSYAASNSSGNAIVSANLLVNGSAGLSMSGAGTLTLSGANTYTGGTSVSNGTVAVSGSGTLGATSGGLTVNSGTLDLNGTNQQVATISGNGGMIVNNATGTNQVLTIGTSGTYGGVMADHTSGTGTVGLTKSGGGTLTLSNTNTYSGATTVSAGGLVVTGNLGNTAVAVSPGATFSAQPASGIGYAGTSATVGTSGLTLSGGASSAGQLNMVDNAIGTFRVGSGGLTTITSTVLPMLTFEIGGSAGSIDCLDLGTMGGNATIAAGTKVNFQTLSGASSLATGDYIFLTTAASGLGASVFALNSSTMTVGGTVYNLSLSGSSATQEILHVAPAITTTPTTYTLAATASTAKIHVGGSSTITATITNTGIAPQDTLDYTNLTLSNVGQLTGTWPKSANGSPIASGGGTDTTAGSITGATAAGTYIFIPTVASATNHTIGNGAGAPVLTGTTAVTVDVYALASPVVSTSLGNFHVGVAKALGLINGTAGDHNEDLDASISAGTNTSASGAVTGLLAGATDNSHLLVTLGGGAGLQTGQVTVGLTSTGTVAGVSNSLGTTALTSQTVAISGTGYNLAAAAATRTVNLGAIHVGGAGSAAVTLTNTAPTDATYTETLGSGLFSGSSSGITTGGLVSGIVGGGSGSGTLSVGFDSSVTAGAGKSGTTTLALNSTAVNGSGLGTTSVGSQTITVTGDVFNGSGTWKLASGTSSSWGTNANWTDANGASGAPGTFAGFDNVDTATFNGTGTATTINLDTASPSLNALTFSGGTSYVIAQGSGSNNLTLKSDTGTATVTVGGSQTITAPVTLTSNGTFATALVSDVLAISGNVDGAGSLTKTGSGTLTLSAASNSYSGGTTLNGGTLSFGTSLPTSNQITFNGGVLEYSGAASLGTYTINPGTASAYVNVTNAAGNLTIVRPHGNYGALVKDGAGTITLANGNQDSGDLSVNGGTAILAGTTSDTHYNYYDNVANIDDVLTGATVKLGNTNQCQIFCVGTFHMSGGTYDVNGKAFGNLTNMIYNVPAIDGSGTITNSVASTTGMALFYINGTKTFSGNIVDGAAAAKVQVILSNAAGTGTWILSGDNTYSGATTITNGTLQAASTTALSPNSAYSVASGKTLNLANYNNSIGSLTGAGNVTLGTATLTLGTDNTSPAAFSGAISGTGGLIKTGSGIATLSGANNYSGGTVVDAGTLTGTGATPLGATTGTLAVNNPNTGAGTAVVLNLSTTAATTTGTLSGTLATPASGTNTATINNGGQLFTVNQMADATYSGTIAGSGGFTLGGLSTNKLVLSGTNTYGGTTTVSAGTLLVNGSLTGSGAVGVAAGATLGGTGSIAGTVTVNGGTLAPGASVESLATGALTLNPASTFAYEMNSAAVPSAAADFEKVFGALALNGTVNLTLTDLAGSPLAFAENTTLSLMKYSGAWNGGFFTYAGSELTDNEVFTAGLNTWKITYGAITGGVNFASEYPELGGQFINLTAIPEPASLLALGCLVGSGAFLRSRRKRE